MNAAAGGRLAYLALVLLSVGGGILMSIQTRVNAGLAVEEASGFYSAAWSFGSGFLVVAVVAMLLPRVRQGVVRFLREVAARRLPWYLVAGGAIGAFFVFAQGIAAPVIGLALFTVVGVAGQSLGAITLDRMGVIGMPRRDVTWPRLAGAVLVVVAVVIASWPELGVAAAWWLIALPLVNGLLRGVQQAINGQIRAEAGSALASTFVNFAGGATVLVIAGLVAWAVTGRGPVAVSTPWLLVGGLLGLVHIFIQSFGVRRLGVLVLGLAMIAGQLAAAVVIDLVAPLPGTTFTWLETLGAILAFGATGIAAIPVRRGKPLQEGRSSADALPEPRIPSDPGGHERSSAVRRQS